MGVPTWRRLGRGWGWMCTRRRWSPRSSTASRASCACSACSAERAKVTEFCAALPGPVRVSYEAGPTGFGLARALEQAGVGCVIAAPGKIARPATDRVKTDRRDAELLVRLLMAGQLSAVRVPSVREEACRDLVRAREDVRGDLMRARHRVGKLLLRHDQRFDGSNWTGVHRRWLDSVELADPIAQ